MDSFFKAAVCELDKLLDEFEQSTGESDYYRTAQNPYDSKHHFSSSVLDGLCPHSSPELQEDANSCTSSKEIPLASHTGTSEVLSYSPQNEQSVSELHLLSAVDSGSLNETQASNLRRCSIPVCDLISDTGRVIHSVAAHEDTQKLQLDDFQYSEGLTGFGVSCIPVPTCVSSAGCSGASQSEHSDGEPVPEDSRHPKMEEMNNLSLKSNSCATAEVSNLCDDQHNTEAVKCSEVLDELEQTARLNYVCVPATSQNLNAYSPKDEKSYEKLPCEPEDESMCSVVSKEMYGRNVVEDIDSKDKSNVESMPSNLPKRPQLHESLATLPGNCIIPDSSCQAEAKVELENKITEDNVVGKKLNSNEILESVSTSCISADNVQACLSFFPSLVSAGSSLVETEGKVNPLPQDEITEVGSDTVTVHAGKSKTDLSEKENCKNTDFHEQEGYVDKNNESIVEKSTNGEKDDTENITDDTDSQQIKVFASTFIEQEAEHSRVDRDSYFDKMISPIMPAFTVKECVIKRDIPTSDAELDKFWYGQHLQSSVRHSSVNGGSLEEADADEGNSSDTNSLDFRKITKEIRQGKLEKITSINNNIKVPLCTESAAEENMPRIQDITESAGEALFSDAYREGARPKQLVGLSQGQKQLNRIHVLEEENQKASSVTPAASPSGTLVNAGKNSEPTDFGEGSSKARGGQTSGNVEPPKIPAALSQKQPLWIPDAEAPNCMNCQVKFTFTKRRHHCRACGKVFCGGCCKRKCKLQYMEKEARVCNGCYDDINKAQAFERMMSPTGPVPTSSISPEYPVPPVEESQIPVSACSPSPSAVLPISALKQPGIEGLCPKEQRRVWFADGILPNGEVADTMKLSSGAKRSSQDSSPVNPDLPEVFMAANPEENAVLTDANPKLKEATDIKRAEEFCPVYSDDTQQAVLSQSEVVHNYKSVTAEDEEHSSTPEAEKTGTSSVDQTTSDMPVSSVSYRALCGVENCVCKEISLIPGGEQLPPLLLAVREKGRGPLVEEHPSHQQVTSLLVEEGPNPLTFILNANLLVNVKLITYFSERCWYFSTNGLHGLGQAEIIILLQCLPDEEIFPKEILTLFNDIYKDAVKGRFIRNTENINFTENFLGSKEHGGFLFVSPSFQKLDERILPDNPFLCGILIHKLEIPWAKAFPLHLMLRLGAEYGAYPTFLLSVRNRKPLFGETGHTVMDLRNFQNALHSIDNLFVHVEMGRSCIIIPLRKHNEV
ncbi:ZFY16 protein, partial [Oreotrochilus melanogaster]|nr:ZFY16 protein [Oreotrochilus melanogaster]